MHIHRYGHGPAAYVGIHGWGGSHATFEPLASHVPPFASLFAVDLPGYGWSPPPPSWSAASVGEAIAEAIHGLEVHSVTLIGNCSGAIFALLAASHLRPRPVRLVLIDPFAFVPWYFRVFVHPVFGRPAYYTTFANPLGRWLTNISLKRRRTEGSDLTRSFAGVDHEVSLRYLQMLQAMHDIDQFSDVCAHVDILYGERTFAAVKQSLLSWVAVWPEARLIRMDGAGHLPIVEAPLQLASTVFRKTQARPHGDAPGESRWMTS